ncbi:MAG: SDR family oxidoreductase [Burkholderiaceae bacterium]|nr:SDR family oxidoreductase [Burkholderiaceae bacterium]
MLMKDKIVIVTGAGSPRGLGRATAQLLAEHGARVLLADVDLAGAQANAAALPGGGHLAVQCDVRDKASCDAAAQFAIGEFGRIDALVNMAGISSPQRLMEVDAPTYDRIMDINMRGTLHMTQAVVPQMRSQKSGSIVNLASVSAQRGGGVFGGSHYCASKGAVLGYTKASARELAPDNVRVNAINPSYIDTDIAGDLMTEERMRMILASVPMGRVGHAHEVAGCVLFLASDLSSYVTGSEIDINGGSHIH